MSYVMLQYYSSRYFLKKNLYWNSLTPFFINWKYTVLMSELCTRRQQETVKYLSLFYPTKCKTVFDANLTMEQFASKCIFIRLASWWPVIVSVWFEQTHSTWQFQFELPCQQSNTAPLNHIILLLHWIFSLQSSRRQHWFLFISLLSQGFCNYSRFYKIKICFAKHHYYSIVRMFRLEQRSKCFRYDISSIHPHFWAQKCSAPLMHLI